MEKLVENTFGKLFKYYAEAKRKFGFIGAMVSLLIGIAFVIAIVAVLLGAIGTIFAGLWNWIIPSIFTGVGTLTWLQGTGLFVLIRWVQRPKGNNK